MRRTAVGVVAAAQRRERLPERAPLAGAMDLRMGGKNLLAQRGAGARHADDEHRRRVGIVRRARRPASGRGRSSAILASTKARWASRENGWKRRSSAWPACQ